MSFLYSGSLWSSLYCGISSLCVGLYRWHIIFDSSLLWSFIFLCCLLWSLHSLVLLIWSFSLYFLMSLANGLSILFILSKNQLLALLIFAMVSFVSFAFISALIFKISFLLLTLGFFISSFSSFFRCRVRLFIWLFSCFLRYASIAMNFSLRTALKCHLFLFYATTMNHFLIWLWRVMKSAF